MVSTDQHNFLTHFNMFCTFSISKQLNFSFRDEFFVELSSLLLVDIKEDILYSFSGLWFWTPVEQRDASDWTVKSVDLQKTVTWPSVFLLFSALSKTVCVSHPSPFPSSVRASSLHCIQNPFTETNTARTLIKCYIQVMLLTFQHDKATCGPFAAVLVDIVPGCYAASLFFMNQGCETDPITAPGLWKYLWFKKHPLVHSESSRIL